MYDRNPLWFALVISIFVALLYIVNEMGIEYFLSCLSKSKVPESDEHVRSNYTRDKGGQG
jgi:hypothetical protein